LLTVSSPARGEFYGAGHYYRIGDVIKVIPWHVIPRPVVTGVHAAMTSHPRAALTCGAVPTSGSHDGKILQNLHLA
jgi:hypothetical protein